MYNEWIANSFRNIVKRERKHKTNDDILSELLRDGKKVVSMSCDEEDAIAVSYYEENSSKEDLQGIIHKVKRLNDSFLTYEVQKAIEKNAEINNEISDIIIDNLNTPKNLKRIAEKFYNAENVVLKIEIEPHPNDELIFKDVILEENNAITNKIDMIKIVLGHSQPEVIFIKIYRAADHISNKLKSIGFNVFARYRDLSFDVSLKSSKSRHDYWEPNFK